MFLAKWARLGLSEGSAAICIEFDGLNCVSAFVLILDRLRTPYSTKINLLAKWQIRPAERTSRLPFKLKEPKPYTPHKSCVLTVIGGQMPGQHD